MKQEKFSVEQIIKILNKILSLRAKRSNPKTDVESVINSDSWLGYTGLVDVGYDKHFRVNNGEHEFSKKNGMHINGIKNF